MKSARSWALVIFTWVPRPLGMMFAKRMHLCYHCFLVSSFIESHAFKELSMNVPRALYILATQSHP